MRYSPSFRIIGDTGRKATTGARGLDAVGDAADAACSRRVDRARRRGPFGGGNFYQQMLGENSQLSQLLQMANLHSRCRATAR